MGRLNWSTGEFRGSQAGGSGAAIFKTAGADLKVLFVYCVVGFCIDASKGESLLYL